MRINLPEWLISSVLYTVAPIYFALQSFTGVYAQCCISTNLLESYNWDFSAPVASIPSGFITDNTYSSVPVGPGFYTIIRSRNWGACQTTPQFDHTTGDTSGRYLWFDTPFSSANHPVAWTPRDPSKPTGQENLIDVQPNTDYVFSVWVRDLARLPNCIYGGAPIAGLSINGTDLGSIDLGAITEPCCPEWVHLCASWNSGNSTIARLQIESRSSNGYTDLGIDDVQFGPGGAIQQVTLGNDTVICDGESITVDVSDMPGNIQWNDGSNQKIRHLSLAGSYWLVSDPSSCIKSDTLHVDVIQPITDSGLDSVIYKCPDEEITLNVSNHTMVQWSTGQVSDDITVRDAGLFWVQISGKCYNFTDTFLIIDEIEQRPITLPTDTELCAYSYYQLPVLNKNYSYHWSTGDTTSSIEVDEDVNVHLTISDVCFDYHYAMEIQTFPCDCEFYVPNTFTPDPLDDINSSFKVYLSGCEISNFEIRIYDRWGEEIFISKNFDFAWDGTVNGQPCQVDVYVYSLSYDALVNRKILPKNKIGRIHLLK